MTEHVKAQALRFARISALAFLAAMATTGGRVSWSSLWALGAGALETGLREMLPVKSIPSVSAVLAPAESALGLPPVAPATAAAVQAAPAPAGSTLMQAVQASPGQTGTVSNAAPPAASVPPGSEGAASP